MSVLGNPADQDRASAQEAPRSVLILDGSNSMWGQLDGDHKIVQLRKAVAATVQKLDGQITLGLTTFGTRKTAECSDLRTLLPPQKLEAGIFKAMVEKISPRGSGPLSYSLKTVADRVKVKRTPTTLVLVADGTDNCRKDPCATAATIKKNAPQTVIHVIGLGRKAAPLQPLSCIAKNTGGVFIVVKTRDELEVALLAALQGGLVTASVAAPGGRTQIGLDVESNAVENAAGPVQSKRKTNKKLQPDQGVLSVSATLVNGGKGISSGLIWRVFEGSAGTSGRFKILAKKRAAKARFSLPAGSYMVNAAYGRAHLTQKLEIRGGEELEANFILNSGGLRLRGVGPDGQALKRRQASYAIYADDRDQFGRRRIIIDNVKPGLIIRLNAGIYHVISRYGDANAKVGADVSVEAGKLTEATVNHTAAQVSFKLVRSAGGEALPGTRWQVLNVGGQLVKRSTGALPTHILAAGTYSVVASHSGKTYRAKFNIKPGDITQIEVVTQVTAQ